MVISHQTSGGREIRGLLGVPKYNENGGPGDDLRFARSNPQPMELSYSR